jgi:hypothetical protein
MYGGVSTITGFTGGSGVAVLSAGANGQSGLAGVLPTTGLVFDIIWLAMLGMLLVSIGIMCLRWGRLVSAERSTAPGVFASAPRCGS